MIERKLLVEILKYIKLKEIIVIHGARQVGKTTLMKMLIEHFKNAKIDTENILYFDLENQSNLDLCNSGVEEFIKYIDYESNIKKKRYIFIDEIQYLNNPSSFLKLFYDHYSQNYKLFVSGSSSFEIKRKFKDSMVGRFFEFELFGLDFEEFLKFKDKRYDITKKIDSKKINEKLIELFREFILFGNYPRVSLLENEEQKEKYLQGILGTYLRRDIREIGNVRDLERFNRILKVLSAHHGLLNIDEISSTLGISRTTVKESISLLENTYIIKRIKPFFSNIRSELTKMPKIYFEDNGLRNILRFGRFIREIDGMMFENSIFTILRRKKGKLKFWRTKSKQEIDFILERGNDIIGYEVKQTYSGKKLLQFESFRKRYPDSILNIITLKKKSEKIKNNNIYLPWEII